MTWTERCSCQLVACMPPCGGPAGRRHLCCRGFRKTCEYAHFLVLSGQSRLTEAGGLCRVIVIVASVIVFKNPMSMQTKISTMVALAGVFAYSQAKRLTKPKTA